jgi:hypothetical protein
MAIVKNEEQFGTKRTKCKSKELKALDAGKFASSYERVMTVMRYLHAKMNFISP